MADGRRTDTRQRIHQVALDVFTERGYDRATLREIAERLEITRPALYYHYKSKEEILASIHAELARSIDEVIAWASSQPDDASSQPDDASSQPDSASSQAGGASTQPGGAASQAGGAAGQAGGAAGPAGQAGGTAGQAGGASSQAGGAAMRVGVLRRLSALTAGPWGEFSRFAQANEAAMRDLSGAAEFIARMDVLTELLRPEDSVAGRIRARLALGALFMASARGQQLGGTVAARRAAALDVATGLVS